jgi:hypothetical protein
MDREATMTIDYSPFTPGQPVSPELFVGRGDEIRRLDMHVNAAISGRLQVAFLTGERGMGKSSLAAFVKLYAERRHGMAGVHAFLGGAGSLPEMVRRTLDHVLNESADKKWYDAISNLFGKTIKQVGLFGINMSFSPSSEELEAVVRSFPRTLREIVSRLKKAGKNGLVLVLDDINGLASSPEFANWLKSLIDEIAVTGGVSLCIFLVGLEERRQALIASQESLARAFDLFPIEPWSAEETAEFFQKAFEQAGYSVDRRALDEHSSYAGGIPMLAHEIGDAIVRVDTDKVIDVRDIAKGIVEAADLLGNKLLKPQVLSAIRSKRYRSILRKLSASQSQSFERRHVKDLLDEAEGGALDDFLDRMKELGVIVPEPEGGPGAYRFSSMLHLIYFKLDAARHEVR